MCIRDRIIFAQEFLTKEKKKRKYLLRNLRSGVPFRDSKVCPLTSFRYFYQSVLEDLWRYNCGAGGGSGVCKHTAALYESPSELQLTQEGLLFCFLETKDPAEVVART